MVDITSPRAVRVAAPRWLDARFVLGVLLVVASVLAGTRILAAADRYDRVLVAAHPLTVGERVTAADFRVGRARLYGSAADYVSADKSWPTGYRVTRAVGQGELVPATALSRTGAVDTNRLVSVPVTVEHFPAGLAAGELVDVYVTPHGAAGGTDPLAPAKLVLGRATVVQAGQPLTSLGVASSSVGVLLSVPAPKVAALVGAIQQGGVDLVRLPDDAAMAQGSESVSPSGSTSGATGGTR